MTLAAAGTSSRGEGGEGVERGCREGRVGEEWAERALEGAEPEHAVS